MSDEERLRSERLVEIHRVRDEWLGNLLVGYLNDNGVEAALQAPPSVPPLDAAEKMSGTDKVGGIFVLEHEAEQAAALVKEYLAAAPDDSNLEETAAQKLKVDRETITRLREAVREERRTFEFLGWVGVVFLGAAAMLWAIWPVWLKIAVPPPALRWVVVILLALAVGFVGRWSGRRL